ncbi:MAG: hypothetical protein ABGX27_08230 [Desulfurobacteriaceae bacterium]
MEKLQEILSSILGKWKELPRWQKILFISILAILLNIVFYFVRVAPLKETLETKRKKMTNLQLIVNRLELTKRKKKELEDQIRDLKEKIASLEEKLPTGSEEVADIIKAIAYKEGEKLRVTYFKRLTTENERSGKAKEDKEKKKRKKSKSKKKKKVEDYYTTVVYEIGVKTTYPTFIRWLENVSSAGRIILIKDVYLQGNDEKNYTVVGDVTIKSFILKR